ncbi:MAC/perforin domain-containing protein [Pseudooceanicola sp. HF7]|uniref:MAC/perforin domain-containing protein n=1 Tax=Pseudooceanicola sp. HF7 TaxID=2721560 RepID=UPI00143154AA|nr:MAC/perforin domain-containing protein [Pseudooceanicola sp. HF7]NIZ08095.1 hypothetical protein [Pseudooceanicola sp. HF7]
MAAQRAYSESTDRIPNLHDYLVRGFDVPRAKFRANPIFKASYSRGFDHKWIDWNGTKKLIPNEVAAYTGIDSFRHQSTTILETETDYEQGYAVAVSAKASFMGFGASASSSLVYNGNLFQSSANSYALQYHAISHLKFQRTNLQGPQSLEGEFLKKLRALTPLEEKTEESLSPYFKLLQTYGTHFVESGRMGGTAFMETEIQDSVFNEASSTEIEAALDVGYKGILASGKLEAEAAYDESEFLQEHRNAISIRVKSYGGTSSVEAEDWSDSLYNAPILLLVASGGKPVTEFRPISDLAELAGVDQPERIAESLLDATLLYSLLDETAPGLIGSGRKLGTLGHSHDMNKEAGFVLGTAFSHDARGLLSGKSGPEMTPGKVRVSQRIDGHSPLGLEYGSVLLPVPQKDRYVLDWTGDINQAHTEGRQYQLGVSTVSSFLGDYTAIDELDAGGIPVSVVSPVDAMLVANFSIPDDNAATARLRLTTGTEDGNVEAEQWICLDAAGDGYATHGSMTVPLCADEQYYLTCERMTGEGDIKVEAWLVPLNMPHMTLQRDLDEDGNHAQIRPDTQFRIDDDGFILGTVTATEDALATVSIVSGPEQSTLASARQVSETVRVAAGTFCLPVPRNTSHVVRVYNGTADVRFFSLKVKGSTQKLLRALRPAQD